MANFGELVVRLALDATGFSSSLAGAKNDLIKWRDETNANTKEMAKWGAAIGATVAPVIALGAAAYATIEKFGGMAQSIKDLSYVTNLSTQKIQELQYAATLSGTEFSTVTMGVQNFTLAISKARDATSDAGKAFAALGVTTSGKTTDQVLEDTFTALVNMKDETERNTIANTLYGRSWREMLPYMEAYIKNAKEIKANPYLTDDDLARLESAKVEIDTFSSKVTILEGKFLSAGRAIDEANTILLKFVSGDNQTQLDALSLLMRAIGINAADAKTNIDALSKLPAPFASSRTDMGSGNPYLSLDAQHQKLKELTDIDLPKYKKAYEDAISAGKVDDATEALDNYWKTQYQIQETNKDIAKSNRDNVLSYQQMVDLQLPQLKEKLEAAKKTGLKTEIEAAQIALDKGVNSANDLGGALGKAAISASNIKSSITIASGWSSKSVIGAAGSNMAAFMIDEMQHGASYQVALDAWTQGAHSYSSWTNGFGTLGAAIDAGTTVTRNAGKNEREALAAATTGKTTGTETTDASNTTTGAGSKKTLSLADQATLDTKTLSTELKKQEDLFSGLNDKIKAGWITLEQDGLVHWTALSELSRIAEQAIMENAYQAASYAGKTPIIQKIVMLSKSGYDIDPSAISVAGPITLAAADFSHVKFLGEDKDKSGSSGGLGAPDTGKTQVNVTVINTGKDIDSIVKADSDDTAISVVSQTGGAS